MSTRIEKQQLAVFKAIDETIALYQQGITECHDIINQPDINHTRLMDILKGKEVKTIILNPYIARNRSTIDARCCQIFNQYNFR